jgi:hypothetical protein
MLATNLTSKGGDARKWIERNDWRWSVGMGLPREALLLSEQFALLA